MFLPEKPKKLIFDNFQKKWNIDNMGSVEQIDQIATWLAQFGSSFPVSNMTKYTFWLFEKPKILGYPRITCNRRVVETEQWETLSLCPPYEQ